MAEPPTTTRPRSPLRTGDGSTANATSCSAASCPSDRAASRAGSADHILRRLWSNTITRHPRVTTAATIFRGAATKACGWGSKNPTASAAGAQSASSNGAPSFCCASFSLSSGSIEAAATSRAGANPSREEKELGGSGLSNRRPKSCVATSTSSEPSPLRSATTGFGKCAWSWVRPKASRRAAAAAEARAAVEDGSANRGEVRSAVPPPPSSSGGTSAESSMAPECHALRNRTAEGPLPLRAASHRPKTDTSTTAMSRLSIFALLLLRVWRRGRRRLRVVGCALALSRARAGADEADS
jgi:hypothetical protein